MYSSKQPDPSTFLLQKLQIHPFVMSGWINGEEKRGVSEKTFPVIAPSISIGDVLANFSDLSMWGLSMLLTAPKLEVAHETFSPLAAIFTSDSDEEALELSSAAKYGLAGHFFSENVGRVMRVARKLQCGMIGVNILRVTFWWD
jgi:hypothetical protein